MNILPKKSWHVRTKANIERVRKDEALAAEQEKEKQRRIAIAESEARTELLRVRGRKRQRESDGEEEGTVAVESQKTTNQELVPAPEGHINFFREEEAGKTSGTNAEYEAEKKAEQEKQEKAIGLLTYLGQSAIESQTEKPWYQKPPEKRQKIDLEKPAPISFKDEFDLKGKWIQDPLSRMKKYLHQKDKIIQRDKVPTPKPAITFPGHRPKSPKLRPSEETNLEPRHSSNKTKKHSKKEHKKSKTKKEKHKHKKHKKHKHDKTEKSSKALEALQSMTSSSQPSGTSRTIQQLRAERLKREREERVKAEQLMAKMRGEEPKPEQPPEDDRERRYNSQFNPDLVRRKKKRNSHQDFLN